MTLASMPCVRLRACPALDPGANEAHQGFLQLSGDQDFQFQFLLRALYQGMFHQRVAKLVHGYL